MSVRRAVEGHSSVLRHEVTPESPRSVPHLADQVFLSLAKEIEAQGVGKKVVADMFGMALRSYQRISSVPTKRSLRITPYVENQQRLGVYKVPELLPGTVNYNGARARLSFLYTRARKLEAVREACRTTFKFPSAQISVV